MANILICGCGALGSHIAVNTANVDHQYMLVDDDKVAHENILTSAYESTNIGQMKAIALAGILIYKSPTQAFGSAVQTTKTIRNQGQIKRLAHNNDLVVDAFDNIEARGFTTELGIPTVHVSVGEHGIGAIEWDDVFNLPVDGYERGENPVCTNEVGRNLILFTSTVASIIINKFLSTGIRESAYVNVDSLEIFK